jgi:hypothetical protein
MTKVPFKAEDLKAGDIISLQGAQVCASAHLMAGFRDHSHTTEWSRLLIFEVTKRLFKTVVLLDVTEVWTPGDIYNFQIIDLDSEKWRRLEC